MPTRACRPGVALLIALVAIAVIGVLSSGVFLVALREHRDGRDSLRRVRARAAAEYGLYMALAPEQWRKDWSTTDERGLLATRVYLPGGDAIDTVRVWKLASAAFLITSEAVVGSGAQRARRRVGLMVVLRAPAIAPVGVVTARERVAIGGGSSISGVDAPIMPLGCPPPADALPAIGISDPAMVTLGECGETPCLAGEVDVRVTPAAAATDTHERFGEVDRARLADLATQIRGNAIVDTPEPSLDASGECARNDPRNLGDPLRSLGASSRCADHFLVAHAHGDLRISGGEGQALLLVDGDLTLDSGVQLFGIVIVRGELRLSDRARLYGAAFAARVALGNESRINYSRCAVDRAAHAAAVPWLPDGPAWVEMY